MINPATRRSETRQRILDAAGRLFRVRGVDGVGIDAVMREADLTHGGFYLHFASKEALVAEVCGTLLRRSADRWREAGAAREAPAALRRIIDSYLDPNRVAAAQCCLLPTLGADIAHRPEARAALREPLEGMLDSLAACLPQKDRPTAMAALSTLVGAVVLARLADDTDGFLSAARAALLGEAAAES